MPWGSRYRLSRWKEGAKEVPGGPWRPKSGSPTPSSPHLCVVFGDLPSRALVELLLASQLWGLNVRPSGGQVGGVWKLVAGTSRPGP